MLLLAHAAAGGLARDAFPGAELLFGIAVWGGAWLAGDRTRLRRERMAELGSGRERAEREAERTPARRGRGARADRPRPARSAGHAINVILVHAGLGAQAQPAEEFETIEQVARETVGEIDQLVGALREEPRAASSRRPGWPRSTPLSSATARPGWTSRPPSTASGRPLSGAVDRAAYRILQEALTNAARHGAGSARASRLR